MSQRPLPTSFDEPIDVGSAIPMFSKNGTALSEDERERIAQKRGQCLRCGIKTKDVKGVFKRTTITSEQVYKGICIGCNPEKVPDDVYQAWEVKFRQNANNPAAKFRAAARATAFMMRSPALPHDHSSSRVHDVGGGQVSTTMASSMRQLDQTVLSAARHTSLQPPAPQGRGHLGTTRSAATLHCSAPAGLERSHFDRKSASLHHIDGAPMSSDRNLNISGLRAAKLPSERLRPPLEGGTTTTSLGSMKAASERHYSVVDDILLPSSARPLVTTSERSMPRSSSQKMEEHTNLMLASSWHNESEHRPTTAHGLPTTKTKSLRGKFQHSRSARNESSSSWLAYDHESARSVVVSDFWTVDSTEDIAQVVNAIKENRGHPEVLIQKLHRLRNLAADCEMDTVPMVVDIINDYRDHLPALTAAVGALWCITAESDERKIEAAKCGAIDCILDALRNSQTREDAEFVGWATGAMTCLARGQGNRQRIGNSNGVEAILDALRLHGRSPVVFEWSCRALHALVYKYEDELDNGEAMRKNMMSIDESGGVSVIVAAMKEHHVESIAEGWAAMLLLRLMDHEDGAAVNRVLSQVNAAHGTTACAKILKARSTTPAVLSLTAELMANLVVEAEAAQNNAALQSAVDCIPSITRVMKEHDGDEKVLESCCRLFAKLAMNEQGRQQIDENKALQYIACAMMKHTSNLSLQEAGSWTLWTISSFPACFDLEYAEDAITALDTSLNNFPDEPILLAGASGFSANLFLVPEAIISDVAVHIPIRALKATDPTDISDEQACRALRSICVRTPAKIDVVLGEGGVDCLVKRLRSQSLKASAAACNSLAAMANTNDEIRRSIVDAGALDGAVSLLGNLRSEASLEEALDLISSLVAREKKRQSVKLPNDIVSLIIEKIEVVSCVSELVTKACDAVLNLLLATGTGSKSLELHGLVRVMTKILDTPASTVIVKRRACTVLWTFVTKQKPKDEKELSSMFQSVVAVMRTYKGEDNHSFESDLQSAAAGALSCISARLHETSFPITSDDVDAIIAVMYMVMEHDRERTEILEKLLTVIFNVSLVNESLAVQCGAIVVVIDSMADHENDESILEVGCSILGLLSSTDDLQVNLCIAETDGIDTLISALASYPSNERVQVAGCTALSHLSIDKESREMIVSQGGLMLVVNAMNSYRENVDLLTGALSALLNLSSDAHEHILADTRALQSAIEIMRLYPDVPQIQENGLGVLQNLSMRSSEGKREIAKLGGIKLLIDAIKSFMGVPKVLERAFTTMWSLALLDSNQKVIAMARGAELVVNGMLAQLDSASVQRQACGCLCTLSTDSQNNALIRDVDGVDAIVYAIWAHFDKEPVLSDACKALASVVVDMNTHEVIVAQEGEVNAVVSAMRCFPKSAKLQENACVALRNLLLSPESIESVRFLSDDIRTVMTAAANRFPEECSECASQVLGKL